MPARMVAVVVVAVHIFSGILTEGKDRGLRHQCCGGLVPVGWLRLPYKQSV